MEVGEGFRESFAGGEGAEAGVEYGVAGDGEVGGLDVEFSVEFGDPVGGFGVGGEAVDVFGLDVGDGGEGGPHLAGAEGVLFRCHGPNSKRIPS